MTKQKRLFVRSLDHSDPTRGFLVNPVAPRIPDAVVYGGIARANVFPLPGRGTVVAVDALNLIEGDQVTLYWHDPVTPVESRAVPPDLNTTLIFDVPADVLRRFPPFPPEGPVTGDNVQVEVWYTIYRAFPEELFTSDKAIVNVDWLVPGDPDPDPTTPYVNENLAPLVIPAPVPTGQDLILSIPRWKNAARGDRLTIAWGATQFLVATLADSLGEAGPALIATVPWVVIDNAGDNIVATYYVLDAVSNHSLWAPSVVPDVEAGDRLPAPTILGLSDDDDLDADELAGGEASVEVRYPGALAGDRITLTWTGQTREGIPLPEFYLEATLPTPPTAKHTFKIPFAQVAPLIDGSARVFYTAAPLAGSPLQRSSSATARVVGTAVALPAPTVREASGSTLDPVGTATVIVRTDYPFARPGDRITMLWQGKASSGAIVIEQQDKLASDGAGSELPFSIPSDKLTAIAGGTVEVSYTVRASGNVVVASAILTLTIGGLGEAFLLAPPSIDGATGGTLDMLDVGAVVIVRVPANAAFQPGDMVDVAWFGASDDGTYVGTNARPAAPAGVSFEVPRSVAEANVGLLVNVHYAFARSGQAPRLSQPRQLAVVDGTAQGDLPAPLMPEAGADDMLSTEEYYRQEAFHIRVPAYDGMAATDTVRATWQTPFGRYDSDIRPVGTIGPMDFQVIRPAVLDAIGLAGEISYTVKKGAADARRSKLRPIRVQGQGMTLPAPTIDAALTEVTVSYPGMGRNQQVAVRWFGVTTEETAEQNVKDDTPLTFRIPAAWVAANRGKHVVVNYHVGLPPGQNTQFSRALRLTP